jgi:glycerate-2-kinase
MFLLLLPWAEAHAVNEVVFGVSVGGRQHDALHGELAVAALVARQARDIPTVDDPAQHAVDERLNAGGLTRVVVRQPGRGGQSRLNWLHSLRLNCRLLLLLLLLLLGRPVACRVPAGDEGAH